MLRSSNYETDLYIRELNKEKDVLDLYALDALNRNYISNEFLLVAFYFFDYSIKYH